MKHIYRVEIYADDYNGYGVSSYYPLSDFYANEAEAKKVAENKNNLDCEELNKELILVGGFLSDELFGVNKAEVIRYDLNV